MAVRDSKPVPFQAIHERRHDTGGDKLADDFTVFDPPLLKLEDRLGCDGAPFHAGDFGKFDHLSAAVAQSRQLDDDVDGGGGLLAQRSFRQVDSRHQHHGFQPRESVASAISVNRADGTVMTGVHGLHHV